MTQIILENARIFDGVSDECPEGMTVLVEDGTIREVSDRPIRSDDARRVDVAGKTLMPGLIDLHVHSYFSDLDPRVLNDRDAPYRTAYAIRKLGHALDSGFTTVRDIGGGDYPLAAAIADGLIRAPRFFYAGKVLSMTGGHVDYRTPNEKHHTHGYCSCASMNWAGVIADGVDECIKATREELRRGAHCIKIVASGGVMSPSDPIWMNQFREDEIRAIVQECAERRTYVAAHCLTSESARRSVEFGVRCIEHAAIIDAETAAFVAERGAYVVPTMVCLFSLVEQGLEMGLPSDRMGDLRTIYEQSMSGLDVMRSAGVKLGFGTDLLAGFYPQQSREFELRREVFTPLELLRQATSVGAEVLMQTDRLGCVKPGAHADLLVVDGDPLADIGLLSAGARNLDLVMRGGEIVTNRLS
ncbi:amidohydrolase family protein [Pimelobacter simplex]|uniref:metal-dependent hydrolase family protein n=1 Tax=Nocardioides simplex TaxID=2045 RepID=UPI000535CE19|nr:amidohydrolase family protein [Pimelobacter simplex]MCG8149407.1 amidohydrolase family protein [Pimelobacter simplex]GEB16222.1 peptidase M38 [Pimelobacter simplex]SFM19514.1 Imidazolonepropionase [Pimelobacter simplex]